MYVYMCHVCLDVDGKDIAALLSPLQLRKESHTNGSDCFTSASNTTDFVLTRTLYIMYNL